MRRLLVVGMVSTFAGCAAESVREAKRPTAEPVEPRDEAETAQPEIITDGELSVGTTKTPQQQKPVDTQPTADPTTPSQSTAPFEWLPVLSDAAKHRVVIERFGVNPTIAVAAKAESTVLAHPHTASFGLALAYLREGLLPPEGVVRTEAFINAFSQRGADSALTSRIDIAPAPHRRGYELLEISTTAPVAGDRPRDIYMLLDRVPSRHDAMTLDAVIERAGADDRVFLVHPNGQNHDVKPQFSLVHALNAMRLEEGQVFAPKLHPRRLGVHTHFLVFSDGTSSPLLEAPADATTWVVGLGRAPYDDSGLSRLASNLDARYIHASAPLPSLEPARVSDVRISVRFDPNVVERYRLLGYERYGEAKGTTQGGHLRAGESVTALYEIKRLEDRRPLGTASITYTMDAIRDERRAVIRNRVTQKQPTIAMLAALAAEKLRRTYWSRTMSWAALERLASKRPPDGKMKALLTLFQRARALDQRPDRFASIAPLPYPSFDHVPVLVD